MQELPAISEVEIESLNVYGARVHNLKNVDVHIPRNKLVVITGISGSGKSSLAFDTIYAEGQRRYMESFSAYARQFIGSMERPDVEKITGLSPVISIEQKTTNKNPRSTVGTITEIYDFMRLLYARTGEAYSHVTGKKMVRFTEQEIVQHVFKHFRGKKIVLLAPVVKGRKGHYRELFEQLRKQGYVKVRIDGEMVDIIPKMQVDRYKIHDIEVVIDRLKVETKYMSRITSSLETTMHHGKGLVMILEHETDKVQNFSKLLMDPESGVSYDEPSPNTFSFNSPYGACRDCKGLGFIHDADMNLIIPDKKLSINEQGIRPFGEVRDNYTFKKLRALSQKYKFTFATPIEDLPEKALEVMLYGTDGKSIPVNIQFGKDRWYDLEFEGVVKTVKRCYGDKDISERIRRWAETFMVKKQCPTCNGQRLKRASLHFKIVGKNIADLCEWDIAELHKWFSSVEEDLTPRQKVIAKDILKEIRARLGFFVRCRFGLFDPQSPLS